MNIVTVEVEATEIDFRDNPICRVVISCYKDLDTGKVWIKGAEGKWDFEDGTESYFGGFVDAVLKEEKSYVPFETDRILYYFD